MEHVGMILGGAPKFTALMTHRRYAEARQVARAA
jgi:hypothetical protein